MEEMEKVESEMLLNASNEAASRIMVAERKADFLNKDLEFLRDDYARMLLQLNNTFNFQAKEAEAKSLNQQKKIHELEAQLGEAEGIIVDLRFELKQLHEKFKILKNDSRPSNGSMAGSKEHINECLPQDNAPSPSTTPNPSNGKSSSVSNIYSAPGKSNSDDTCSEDEDIIQNTEPDLCRNECSRRNLATLKTSTLQAIDFDSLVNVPVCALKYDVENQNCISDNMDQVTTIPSRSAGKNARYSEAIASLRSYPCTQYVKSWKQPLCGQLKLSSSLSNEGSVKNPMKAVQQLLEKKLCSEVINMVCAQIDGEEAREGLSKKKCVTTVDVLAGSDWFDVPISVEFGSFERVENVRPLKFTFQPRCKCKLDVNVVPLRVPAETKQDSLTDVCVVQNND